MKTNLSEFNEIIAFCEGHTKDYSRFDPFLHLRTDKDKGRNKEIQEERLTADEICMIEEKDGTRAGALMDMCRKSARTKERHGNSNLFRCGAGRYDCAISWDGKMKTCQSLNHPDFIYDMRKGSLDDGWNFISALSERKSKRKLFAEKCGSCRLANFCMWCPARGYLECGKVDMPVDLFCQIAHARLRHFGRSPHE